VAGCADVCSTWQNDGGLASDLKIRKTKKQRVNEIRSNETLYLLVVRDSFALKQKNWPREEISRSFSFSPISSINIFFPSFTDTFPRYLPDFYHVRGIWFHLVRACLRACMFSVANKWSFFLPPVVLYFAAAFKLDEK
jgi:hypothetical protein